VFKRPDNTPLSTQAQALYTDVIKRCGHINEQLLMLSTLAPRHAVSTADVAAVRERLLAALTSERTYATGLWT
jgi:hypothetical protein